MTGRKVRLYKGILKKVDQDAFKGRQVRVNEAQVEADKGKGRYGQK